MKKIFGNPRGTIDGDEGAGAPTETIGGPDIEVVEYGRGHSTTVPAVYVQIARSPPGQLIIFRPFGPSSSQPS